MAVDGNHETAAALLARTMALSGRSREAAALLRKVLSHCNRQWVVLTATTWLVDLLIELGDLDMATDLVRDSRVSAAGSCDLQQAQLLLMQGNLEYAAGRFRRGLDRLMACGRQLNALGAFNSAAYEWRPKASLCASALHRDDLAAVLAQREMEYTQKWGTPWRRALALHALALARRDEHSAHRLREAKNIMAGGQVRSGQPRVLYDLGVLLAEGFAYDEAGAVFADARAAARQSGNARLADCADHAIRRLATMRRSAAPTRQEIRVARLARAGQSNKEIAEQLHLSVGTVEQHLSNFYRKLSISGRANLSHAMT
jgi:DNA-binding CsgD family transcriptional regulator